MAEGYSKEQTMSDLNADLRKIILGLEGRGTKEDFKIPASNKKQNGASSNCVNTISSASRRELMSHAQQETQQFDMEIDTLILDLEKDYHGTLTHNKAANDAIRIPETIMANTEAQPKPQPLAAIATVADSEKIMYPRKECWTPIQNERKMAGTDYDNIPELPSAKSRLSTNLDKISWTQNRLANALRPTSAQSDCESILSSTTPYFNWRSQSNTQAKDELIKNRISFKRSCGLFCAGLLTGATVVLLIMVIMASGKTDDADGGILCKNPMPTPAALVARNTASAPTDENLSQKGQGSTRPSRTEKLSTTQKPMDAKTRTANSTNAFGQNQTAQNVSLEGHATRRTTTSATTTKYTTTKMAPTTTSMSHIPETTQKENVAIGQGQVAQKPSSTSHAAMATTAAAMPQNNRTAEKANSSITKKTEPTTTLMSHISETAQKGNVITGQDSSTQKQNIAGHTATTAMPQNNENPTKAKSSIEKPDLANRTENKTDGNLQNGGGFSVDIPIITQGFVNGTNSNGSYWDLDPEYFQSSADEPPSGLQNGKKKTPRNVLPPPSSNLPAGSGASISIEASSGKKKESWLRRAWKSLKAFAKKINPF